MLFVFSEQSWIDHIFEGINARWQTFGCPHNGVAFLSDQNLCHQDLDERKEALEILQKDLGEEDFRVAVSILTQLKNGEGHFDRKIWASESPVNMWEGFMFAHPEFEKIVSFFCSQGHERIVIFLLCDFFVCL